jgi:anchored repeat ABC transporter substrate-binding protein
VAVALVAVVALAAFSLKTRIEPARKFTVVVTTEIIADLVRQVAGERAEVVTVVPPGGDPHSYEPTTADARKVAIADVAFTNHLLLEEHALIKLFDSNVRRGVPNVSLAESAERYGAHLIPFVEDVRLDVPWLGLAVRGEAQTRTTDVRLRATALDGPGDLVVYVTDVFGRPQIYFDSRNGFAASDGVALPGGAHTHVNWAFTRAGVYALTLSASLQDASTTRTLGSDTFTFIVGIAPSAVAGARMVLTEGHADVAVDLASGQLFLCTAALSCAEQVGDVPPRDIVIEVPNRALALVPDGPQFAFLGSTGAQYWELPQAVLGKHVHGIIDPHAWEDVKNARAYVQVIADTLIGTDPEGRALYETNRNTYVRQLDALDSYVADRLRRVPAGHRNLVTTHDAFSYLAAAYGMKVAGFVVPNPAQEPSAVQVTRLIETVRNLQVPAVFAEPNLHARASVLKQVAHDQGVQVCELFGDSFGEEVHNYLEMMRFNADEILRCLGGPA